MLALPIPSFTFGELIIFGILVIAGIIIILILSAAIHFIVPIIAAVVVCFLTGNLLYVAIAFVGLAI